MATEILSAEQPCILCGQLLEVVTITSDTITGEERIERNNLDHNSVSCLAALKTYREEWPWRLAF